MASPRNDAANGASGNVGSTQAAEEARYQVYERRVATWLITGIAMLLVFLAVMVSLFGLPVLGIYGLVGTGIVMVTIVAYAAGW